MQTSSITPKDFIALGGPNLVYVREVSAREILAEAPSEARRTRRSTPCIAATANGLRSSATATAPSPPRSRTSWLPSASTRRVGSA